MDFSYDKIKKLYSIKDSGAQISLTGDLFKNMGIKDEIHRLKLECIGGTCSIDDPEYEACVS